MRARYTADKPKSCKYCYFFDLRTKECELGKENCFYIEERKEKPKASQCDGCPYGLHSPCIGYCMQKILKEHRHEI